MYEGQSSAKKTISDAHSFESSAKRDSLDDIRDRHEALRDIIRSQQIVNMAEKAAVFG